MHASGAPTRLALQTGELDDHRPSITPQHELWPHALPMFRERHDLDDAPPPATHDDDMSALCAAWPKREGPPESQEALAVAFALASPFAEHDRLLAALSVVDDAPADLERPIAGAVVIASREDPSRRGLPLVYDPDTEDRAPIVAILDGPRNAGVAELLDRIQRHDRNLADAMVLGADIEMFDLLDRLCLDATRAGRRSLSEMFEHDQLLWRGRADAARARHSLEGLHYGWRTGNVPPGCLEAARSEVQHHVDDLHLTPPAG